MYLDPGLNDIMNDVSGESRERERRNCKKKVAFYGWSGQVLNVAGFRKLGEDERAHTDC